MFGEAEKSKVSGRATKNFINFIVITFILGIKMYQIIEIGKRIAGDELERILVEAAEEVGLKATSIDEQRTEYGLGPVYKEQVYSGTTIRLRGSVFPIAEVSGIKKGEERDWFSIGTRFNTTSPYFGFGSEKQIEEYLRAVSEHLWARPLISTNNAIKQPLEHEVEKLRNTREFFRRKNLVRAQRGANDK